MQISRTERIFGWFNSHRLVPHADPIWQRVDARWPGSEDGLYLVVSDIQAARKELADCGIDVSESSIVRPLRRSWSARSAPT